MDAIRGGRQDVQEDVCVGEGLPKRMRVRRAFVLPTSGPLPCSQAVPHGGPGQAVPFSQAVRVPHAATWHCDVEKTLLDHLEWFHVCKGTSARGSLTRRTTYDLYKSARVPCDPRHSPGLEPRKSRVSDYSDPFHSSSLQRVVLKDRGPHDLTSFLSTVSPSYHACPLGLRSTAA